MDKAAVASDSADRGSISRRGLVKTAAMVASAGAAGTMFAGPALAAIGGVRLRSFDGRYAIRGGRIIHGYFTAPAGKSHLDLVVVVPGEGVRPSRARALADQHARAGRIAIVPDLDATFRNDPAVVGHGAKVAALVANTPNLKRLTHGNGNVAFVNAA